MPQQLSGLLPIILMLVVFYFLLIRPQSKRDKQIKQMRAGLRRGNEIVTIGGFYGKITNIHDDVLTIVIGPEKTKLKIARWAIAEVIDKDNNKKEEKEEKEQKNQKIEAEVQDQDHINQEEDPKGE